MTGKTANEAISHKEEVKRLRARFKYALGAYHLLEDRQEHANLLIDGLRPHELRTWADEVIDGMLEREAHTHFYLTNLASIASDRNRRVVDRGNNKELVIYEPNVAWYVETYKLPTEEAVRLLNEAVNMAIRHWMDAKGGAHARD